MAVVWVWVGVGVLTLVVLGGLVYGVLGALQRLRREMRALDHDLRPVLDQVQQSLARAGETAHGRSADR